MTVLGEFTRYTINPHMRVCVPIAVIRACLSVRVVNLKLQIKNIVATVKGFVTSTFYGCVEIPILDTNTTYTDKSGLSST